MKWFFALMIGGGIASATLSPAPTPAEHDAMTALLKANLTPGR